MNNETTQLREVTGRLLTMEGSLTLQRAQLLHYLTTAVYSGSPCSGGKMDHSSLDSMLEKYVCDEGDYRMELESFWDLTKSVVDTMKGVDSVTECAENAEVTDSGDSTQFIPYLQDERDDSDVSTTLSSRRCSESTQCVLNDHVSLSESRGIADDLICGEMEAAQSMMYRESEKLDTVHDSRSATVRVLPGGSVKAALSTHPASTVEPVAVTPVPPVDTSEDAEKIQNVDSSEAAEDPFPALPRSKAVSVPVPSGVLKYKRNLTAAVKNNMVHRGYKYGGKGFGIWKQNHGKPLYTTTELHCTKTCGGDADRLKKYFVAKGGFKASQIRMVRMFKSQENKRFSRVFVRGTMESIESGIEKMNAEKEKNVVSLYGLRWNDRSRKLMVRNFDILTEDDHRKFTKLFLKFGDLDCDLVMKKNKNGVNYALVTFCSKQDARKCERNQNDSKFRRGNALAFNGRDLMIGYVNEKKGKKM